MAILAPGSVGGGERRSAMSRTEDGRSRSDVAGTPSAEMPPVRYVMAIVFGAFLFVDLTLTGVMAVGISAAAGEGVVSEKIFKHEGSPSLKFADGRIIPAVGAYYAISNGDHVRKAKGSLVYEVNGEPINALLLYVHDLVVFTVPMALLAPAALLIARRLTGRRREPDRMAG